MDGTMKLQQINANQSINSMELETNVQFWGELN